MYLGQLVSIAPVDYQARVSHPHPGWVFDALLDLSLEYPVSIGDLRTLRGYRSQVHVCKTFIGTY